MEYRHNGGRMSKPLLCNMFPYLHLAVDDGCIADFTVLLRRSIKLKDFRVKRRCAICGTCAIARKRGPRPVYIHVRVSSDLDRTVDRTVLLPLLRRK